MLSFLQRRSTDWAPIFELSAAVAASVLTDWTDNIDVTRADDTNHIAETMR